VPEIDGRAVTAGAVTVAAEPPTGRVGVEAEEADPDAFVAVSVARRLYPLSAVETVYVEDVLDDTTWQFAPPESQRVHVHVKASGTAPVQPPLLAARIWPAWGAALSGFPGHESTTGSSPTRGAGALGALAELAPRLARVFQASTRPYLTNDPTFTAPAYSACSSWSAVVAGA
jgi:hypothetical protein